MKKYEAYTAVGLNNVFITFTLMKGGTWQQCIIERNGHCRRMENVSDHAKAGILGYGRRVSVSVCKVRRYVREKGKNIPAFLKD